MSSTLCSTCQEPDSLGDKGCKPYAPDIQTQYHGKQETCNGIDEQNAQHGYLFGSTGLSDAAQNADVYGPENLQKYQSGDNQTGIKPLLQSCGIFKEESKEER